MQGKILEYLDHVTCRPLDRFVRIRDLGNRVTGPGRRCHPCDVAAKGSVKEGRLRRDSGPSLNKPFVGWHGGKINLPGCKHASQR